MARTTRKSLFTFKKQPLETGLASVGNPHPTVDIKLAGMVVGWIDPASWRQPDWRIWLRIKTADGWANRSVKARFDSEEAARKYVTDNAAKLIGLGLSPAGPE